MDLIRQSAHRMERLANQLKVPDIRQRIEAKMPEGNVALSSKRESVICGFYLSRDLESLRRGLPELFHLDFSDHRTGNKLF